MDSLTHGLASFVVTRTFFPRISRTVLIGAITAGIAADIDIASEWFGPSAFLRWDRTVTHSLIGALLITTIFTAAIFFLFRREASQAASVFSCVAPVLCAVGLHLVMDLNQSDGVALLWPFRARKYSADWVAHLDLWILAILLGGVLLPRFFALVTSEIGAKSKGPKGQVGATVSFLLMFVYIGGRGLLHGNATAELGSRTYRGETARRWAALPDSASPFRWHGIVETERALHDLQVDVGPGASFDPDAGVTTYKPEPSAALDAARNTETARRFLPVARFPRASVEKTTTGFRIELQGFPYRKEASVGLQVIAEIETDANARVKDEKLLWAADSK